MTQDERWAARYNEVMEFIVTNHRNPSRHRIEEHLGNIEGTGPLSRNDRSAVLDNTSNYKIILAKHG